MKKALIDPTDNNLVTQVEDVTFEMAPPMYWVDCPDNIIAHRFWYKNNSFVPIPVVTEIPFPKEGG